MFQQMRRFKQELSKEEAIEVFKRNTSGVLALCGNDHFPYSVPIGYVFYENKIYFHCAKQGHKISCISENSKVSFCVIDEDQVVPEEFTTYYRSAIAFGNATIVTDDIEKRKAIEVLAEKYCPNDMTGRLNEINKRWNLFHIIRLDIEHFTGKATMQLINKKDMQ